MENTNNRQEKRVMSYLEQNGSITQFEAYNELGIMRLASRISSLKKKGCGITGENIAVTNRFGERCYVKRYRLEGIK